MARILISGGTVVHPTGSIPSDVLIDGETIAALYAPGVAAAMGVTAERTIDATGKYVVPGGIDAHTHMELPFGGTFASDDFETGTAAAAWGGTTTIIDFALQTHRRDRAGRAGRLARQGRRHAAIDYGFHMILGDVTDEALKAMDELVATRASPASSCSWPTPACSTATTARSCGPCRAPRTTGP